MTKNDYIEKITQNLEHLTKDELKDVSILTTAQLVVRSKFAERQQLEHEITNLTPKLQQQALPVVPECVDLFIKECRKFNYDLDQAFYEQEDGSEATENNKCILWRRNHPDEFARAWLDGYTVEKPQLFYLKNKLTTSYLILDTSSGYFEHWSSTEATGRYKSEFTQQEIDSMETGSYEQIKVEEEK